jgi:hypothetical protein
MLNRSQFDRQRAALVAPVGVFRRLAPSLLAGIVAATLQSVRGSRIGPAQAAGAALATTCKAAADCTGA